MTSCDRLWDAIRASLPANEWTPLQSIYRRVRDRVPLDREDFLPDAPGSSGLKWQRNVRDALQQRKALGQIDWKRPGLYRITTGTLGRDASA